MAYLDRVTLNEFFFYTANIYLVNELYGLKGLQHFAMEKIIDIFEKKVIANVKLGVFGRSKYYFFSITLLYSYHQPHHMQ